MSNWYNLPTVSVDIDSIEAVKMVGVQVGNPSDQVFVDLLLANGQTLQISLSFTDRQLEEIAALGPKPRTSDATLEAKKRRISYPGEGYGWTKASKEKHRLLLMEYQALEEEYNKLHDADWHAECDWHNARSKLGKKFGDELLINLRYDLGIA